MNKSKGEWKIQLKAEINVTSLKPDSDEARIMHTKSDKEEIMVRSVQIMLLKNSLNRFCKDIKKVYNKK